MSYTPRTARSTSPLNLVVFVRMVQCHRTVFTKCTKSLLPTSYRLTAEYKWHHTTSLYVPVGHIWKFDLEEYGQRNFEVKFNFFKIQFEPFMLIFLAKTENLRNTRSERPNKKRGKVVKFSSGNLLFPTSET